MVKSCVKSCFLKHVIEGMVEGMGKGGRRRKQLLADLKKKRTYCNLKQKVLDRTLWRTCFGRGYLSTCHLERVSNEWTNVKERVLPALTVLSALWVQARVFTYRKNDYHTHAHNHRIKNKNF
jgi:hypothetical protein